MGTLQTGSEVDMAEIQKVFEEDEARRETCTHANYKGMTEHGRCCPDCGTFMVDFGD